MFILVKMDGQKLAEEGLAENTGLLKYTFIGGPRTQEVSIDKKNIK